jgi:hypothetical protein
MRALLDKYWKSALFPIDRARSAHGGSSSSSSSGGGDGGSNGDGDGGGDRGRGDGSDAPPDETNEWQHHGAAAAAAAAAAAELLIRVPLLDLTINPMSDFLAYSLPHTFVFPVVALLLPRIAFCAETWLVVLLRPVLGPFERCSLSVSC